MNALRLTILSTSAAALAACASTPDTPYPSLAIRDAERASGQYPVPQGDCAVESPGAGALHRAIALGYRILPARAFRIADGERGVGGVGCACAGGKRCGGSGQDRQAQGIHARLLACAADGGRGCAQDTPESAIPALTYRQPSRKRAVLWGAHHGVARRYGVPYEAASQQND